MRVDCLLPFLFREDCVFRLGRLIKTIPSDLQGGRKFIRIQHNKGTWIKVWSQMRQPETTQMHRVSTYTETDIVW